MADSEREKSPLYPSFQIMLDGVFKSASARARAKLSNGCCTICLETNQPDANFCKGCNATFLSDEQIQIRKTNRPERHMFADFKGMFVNDEAAT